jgi:hypothetical protein
MQCYLSDPKFFFEPVSFTHSPLGRVGYGLPRWMSIPNISPKSSIASHSKAIRMRVVTCGSGAKSSLGFVALSVFIYLFGFVIDDPQSVEPVRVPRELLATLHRVDSPKEILVRVCSVPRRFVQQRRVGRAIRSCRCLVFTFVLGRSFGLGLHRGGEGRIGASRQRCGTRSPSLL